MGEITTAGQTVVVFGAGGTCVDIAEAIRSGRPDTPVLLVDDDPGLEGREVGGFPVVGPLALVHTLTAPHCINGIGSARTYWRRPEILAPFSSVRWETVMHPTAVVSVSGRLDPGVAVLAHAFVGPGAQVAAHGTVLQGAVISHDAQVGTWSIVGPGAVLLGGAHVGDRVFVGARAVVFGGVRVGEGALIGAGSVVRRDVPPWTVVAGNPARRLRSVSRGYE